MLENVYKAHNTIDIIDERIKNLRKEQKEINEQVWYLSTKMVNCKRKEKKQLEFEIDQLKRKWENYYFILQELYSIEDEIIKTEKK